MRPVIQRLLFATCRVDTDTGARASGFFVSDQGYMVTSCHVVMGEKRIHVTWHGQPKPIELDNPLVLAQDFSRDLAVVRLPYKVPFLTPSDHVPEVGDRVIMCGYPLHSEIPRIAEGTISSWPEKIQVGFTKVQAQALNANVNFGNSGGPVCTPDGTVVGVVAAKVAADARATAAQLCRALDLPIDPDRLETVARAFEVFAQRVDAGIGFSIPATQIPSLLESARYVERRGMCDSEDLSDLPVSGKRLSEFQAACNDLRVSPVGPFSCNRNEEIWPVKPYGGRTYRGERTFIPHRIHDLLGAFFKFRPRGGRFYLLGQSLCTYDRKQECFRRYAWLDIRPEGGKA